MSRQFPHLRLRLLPPEPHVHLAVHRHRSGEVLLRLLSLARTSVELAKAEVAVSDERAHTARLAEGQRLAVVGLGRLNLLGRIERRGDGAETVKQNRFLASLLLSPS